MQNSILISDESHNLLEFLDYCQAQGSESLWDLDDVSVKPKTRLKWKEDNDDIMIYRNKLKQYLALFGSASKILFLTGTPVTTHVEDIRWFINLSAGDTVVPFVKDVFSDKYVLKNYVYETLGKMIKPILQVFSVDIGIPDYSRILHAYGRFFLRKLRHQPPSSKRYFANCYSNHPTRSTPRNLFSQMLIASCQVSIHPATVVASMTMLDYYQLLP